MFAIDPNRLDCSPVTAVAMLRDCDASDLLPENFLRPSELAYALREVAFVSDLQASDLVDAWLQIKRLQDELQDRDEAANDAILRLTGE